jgi:prevent-host-death family protein
MDTSGITTSATIDEFHGSLDDAISRVGSGHERVLVTKNGEAVAVLIGPEDFDLLERLELQRDSAEYRAARAADDGGEHISLDEMRAGMAKPQAWDVSAAIEGIAGVGLRPTRSTRGLST